MAISILTFRFFPAAPSEESNSTYIGLEGEKKETDVHMVGWCVAMAFAAAVGLSSSSLCWRRRRKPTGGEKGSTTPEQENLQTPEPGNKVSALV